MIAIVKLDTLDILRSYPDIPHTVAWPSGDISFAPSLGDERDGCRLVRIVHAPDSPGEFYQEDSAVPELSGDVLTMRRVWRPWPMSEVVPTLLARVDGMAEAQRSKHFTMGDGQALVYMLKLAEAAAYQADPSGEYPLLEASAMEGQRLADVSLTVISAASSWTVTASAIEKVRLSAKASIRSATTVDDAVSIFNSVAWP